MANTRGVFFLSKIVEEKIPLNEWVDLETVWHSPPTPNTGYYAGGEDPSSVVTNVEKVDFTTDTLSASTVAGLTLERLSLGGTGNTKHGYFGGGYFPGFYSTMDKVTYSTDDTVRVPGADLFLQVAGSAASGNQTNGYFGGGYDIGAADNTSSFTKIQYSDDTRIAVPATQLNSARNDLSAMGNQLSGYFIGGRNPSDVSTIDKLDYSVETCTSSPSLQYPASYSISGAVGNPSFGMVAGGRQTIDGTNFIYDTVRKLDYSTDNFSNVPALPVGKFGVASFGNGDFAYFGGGRAVPAITSNFVKIQYSTSTYSPVPNLNLGAARYQGASSGARSNGFSSIKLLQDEETRYTDDVQTGPNAGYFAGGLAPGDVSTMDKVDYSSDTTTVIPGANLTQARYGVAGASSRTSGYFGGGHPGPVTTMDKLTYSSDTTAVIPGSGANLSLARALLTATGNADAGYFGGGGGNPYFSTMDKITYSNDTTGAVPGAALTIPRGFHLGATGNPTAGYFAGGNAGPTYSGVVTTVDKVTYASDTTAAAPSAALSVVKAGLAASGNLTHGYFSGGPSGSNSLTLIEKITFSSDSRELVPGLNLAAPRTYHGATGNATAGYHGSGNPAGPQTSIDKINYSTDTSALIPSAAFTTGRRYITAASARDNGFSQPPVTTPSPGTTPSITPIGFDTGYFGGGSGNSSGTSWLSIMDKITYSTDTTAAAPSGAYMSLERYGAAGTGNQTHGYFGGGNSNGNILTVMDKITYASDTTARLPGAELRKYRYYPAATGNSTQGYFAGGYQPGTPGPVGPVSSVDKVTYSTDTTAILPSSANLSISRYPVSATGNETNGYVGGGYDDPAHYSRVDKITYSTDTTAAAPSAFVSGDGGSSGRYGVAATGNSTHGYFGGGGYTSAGFPEGDSTYMDKLTYSSDTTAAVPGANLTGGRVIQGATGNSTAGYFGGGGPGPLSTMDKVTYSTDTTAVVPGAELTFERSAVAAASSRANALPTISVGSPIPNLI